MMSVFILEDITPGVQTQRDWETPGGLAPITECMFMGQKLDIGVVIVSHTLSGLSPIIRQNVGTWLVTGLPGEDPRIVCNVLGTDSKQADKARTLQPGELVCSNPVLLPKPVYARFLIPAIPGICSEATRKSTERPVRVREMRPSWGARVSAMFIFDITLMRTAMAGQ